MRARFHHNRTTNTMAKKTKTVINTMASGLADVNLIVNDDGLQQLT